MIKSLTIFTTVVFFSLGLFACNSNDSSDTTDELIPFTQLAAGSYSGIMVQRFEVVRDEPAFAELWDEHVSGYPEPIQPDVDFSADMVIAVFTSFSTGGHRVAITHIEDAAEQINVYVTITHPGDNCIVTQATSQPYEIVSIPQSPKPVAFDTTEEIHDCG